MWDFLPKDILIEILLLLEPSEINKFCAVNKQINAVCCLDYLWQLKSFNDYTKHTRFRPSYKFETPEKHAGPDWREYYAMIYTKVKNVPIFYQSNQIGQIQVKDDQKLETIKGNIGNLVKEPRLYEFLNKKGEIVSKHDPLMFLSLFRIEVKNIQINVKMIDKICNSGGKSHVKHELNKICDLLGLYSGGRNVRYRILTNPLTPVNKIRNNFLSNATLIKLCGFLDVQVEFSALNLRQRILDQFIL